MHNSDMQRWCINAYNIERKNRTNECNATINARRNIICMLYTTCNFFSEHCKADKIFFAVTMVEQMIRGNYSTGTNSASGLNIFFTDECEAFYIFCFFK